MTGGTVLGILIVVLGATLFMLMLNAVLEYLEDYG